MSLNVDQELTSQIAHLLRADLSLLENKKGKFQRLKPHNDNGKFCGEQIHVGHVALVALTEPHSLFSVKN